MGNWTDELERRRAGEVPGFIGSDESLEDYADREHAELDDQDDDVDETRVVRSVDELDEPAPVKKTATKKAAAKKTTSTRR